MKLYNRMQKLLFALLLGLLIQVCSPNRLLSLQKNPSNSEIVMEKATFGAGCFWGVEEDFRRVKGVASTMVGYAGGKFVNPTYKDVCTGKTGHAEVIQIEFDPSKITYEDLLSIFFQIHNPTTRNRQGPDVGSQYRSVIFYHSADQEKSAQAYIEQLNLSGRYDSPIITEILPAGPFYKAEEYHQKYHEKNGGSCRL